MGWMDSPLPGADGNVGFRARPNGRALMQAVLVVHRDREHANELAQEAASWLLAHGHTAVLPPEDAKCVGLDEFPRPTTSR